MNLKVTTSQIAISAFLISTMFSGIIWEGIGWISLLYCLYVFRRNNRRSRINRRARKFLLLILIIVLLYAIYQVLALGLDGSAIVRLYGITKTTFAVPIIILLLDEYASNRNIVLDFLGVFFIADWLTIISDLTQIDAFNLFGGSRNYLGAINVILFPYIVKFLSKEQHKILRNFYFITLILLVVFSGSRTLMLIAVLMFVATGLLEKGLNKKLRTTLALFALVLLALFVLNNVAETSLISRGLSVFSNISDASRTDLRMFADRQYMLYSDMEKLIGNGNNIVLSQNKPVHNVFGEILLCYGKIGFIFWNIYLVLSLILLIKNGGENKLYLLLIFFVTLLVGWVQPFITSGFLYQSMVGITMLQIYYSEPVN